MSVKPSRSEPQAAHGDGAVRRRVRRVRDGELREAMDEVAAEVPVALAYNGEPFAVMLADDLLDGGNDEPVMKQMVDVYNHFNCSVLGVEEISPEQSRSYGVVDGREWDERVIKMSGIVEKPAPENAPSNLGVVGRYILTPRIFDHIRQLKPGAGGEFQLTDAIQAMLDQEQVLAYRYKGVRFDCGSKLGYLKATVEFALKHPEVRDEFSSYLAQRG